MGRADPLGFDMRYSEDLDPSGRSATGAELVEDGILHRLQVDTLPLAGAPGGCVAWGVDVTRWPGTVTTQERADAKAPEVAAAVARDTRIDAGSIRVAITLTPEPEALYDLEIEIVARTVTGQAIAMVAGVSAMTVELLAQQGQR